MPHVEKSIYVSVPVGTAYDRWTRFDDYPSFMDGVSQVRRLDDKTLLWRESVGGQDQESEVVVTHQTPNQKIAWHSTSGSEGTTTVTFHPTGAHSSRVTLRASHEASATEGGALAQRLESTLKRFKQLMESEAKDAAEVER